MDNELKNKLLDIYERLPKTTIEEQGDNWVPLTAFGDAAIKDGIDYKALGYLKLRHLLNDSALFIEYAEQNSQTPVYYYQKKEQESVSVISDTVNSASESLSEIETQDIEIPEAATNAEQVMDCGEEDTHSQSIHDIVTGVIEKDDKGYIHCDKVSLNHVFAKYIGCKCVINSYCNNFDNQSKTLYPFYTSVVQSIDYEEKGKIKTDGTKYVCGKYILTNGIKNRVGESITIHKIHPFRPAANLQYWGYVISYSLEQPDYATGESCIVKADENGDLHAGNIYISTQCNCNNGDNVVIKECKRSYQKPKDFDRIFYPFIAYEVQIVSKTDRQKKSKGIWHVPQTYYLIDTNILMDCPNLLNKVSEAVKIMIPTTVFDELDHLKKSRDIEKSKKAQQAIRSLRVNRNCFELAVPKKPYAPFDEPFTQDKKIMSIAFQREYKRDHVILVTSDANMSNFAQNYNLSVISLKEFIDEINEKSSEPSDSVDKSKTLKKIVTYAGVAGGIVAVCCFSPAIGAALAVGAKKILK